MIPIKGDNFKEREENPWLCQLRENGMGREWNENLEINL